MENELIISVNEFRRIAGKSTAHFTDEQIVELIQKLDFIALLHIKNVQAGKEENSQDCENKNDRLPRFEKKESG